MTSYGHSIINQASRTMVGKLMIEYGGGGHNAVGICQVPNEEAGRIIDEIIAEIHLSEHEGSSFRPAVLEMNTEFILSE